ncbi:hypothetical protein MTP99_015921 [Tenebrio molitor]|nr:hypothetical protein MTP99_015921 [Tenebrio molitor]
MILVCSDPKVVVRRAATRVAPSSPPQHLTVSATSLLPTSPIIRPYKLQRITQKSQDYSSAPIGKRHRGHPPGHWDSSAREAPPADKLDGRSLLAPPRQRPRGHLTGP